MWTNVFVLIIHVGCCLFHQDVVWVFELVGVGVEVCRVGSLGLLCQWGCISGTGGLISHALSMALMDCYCVNGW